MSLIAGGISTAAVTTISGAIIGTIALLKKIDNNHDREMALISNRHQESMKKLEKEQNDQNNRHKEFIKLLDTLDSLIGRLGDMILNAECEGLKGLPGFFHLIFSKYQPLLALERRFGQQRASEYYNNYLNYLQVFSTQMQRQLL